jgi:hypothetical protein
MNLSNPAMNYDKVEYRMLTLMTGMNGTGKSLVLKFTWCLNLLANCHIVAKLHLKEFDPRKEMQFIIDSCFDEPDFTGRIETYHENGTVKIQIQGGIVIDAELDIDEDVNPEGPIIYMSNATRKFDDIVTYMKFKKHIGITAGIQHLSQDDILKLCSMYKLYDMLFMEQAIPKFDGFVITEELKKTLEETLRTLPDIQKLKVDYEKPDILMVDSRDNTSSITKLSAGEQSYLNMIINSK